MGDEVMNSRHANSTASSNSSHGNGEVDHTPIIITDGSAAIEFAEVQHYRRVIGTSIHRANDLRLAFVQPNMLHDDGTAFCHTLSANEDCVIEVMEQGNKGFTIHAFPDGHTVEIRFDHGVYKMSLTTSPPKGNGHRFGNANRRIVGLRIFVNGNPNPDHDCELVSRPGIEYTILDPHA